MAVALELFCLNDLDSLVKYANNPKIAANLTDQFPYPYTKKDGERFLENVMKQNPTQVFKIAFNNNFCGAIGLHPQRDIMRKNAELGYWIAEPFWGKGIATSAIKEIIPYGFQTFEITRIFARPYGTNKASQRVLQKAGFQLEAHLEKTIFKNNMFLDEFIYAVRND